METTNTYTGLAIGITTSADGMFDGWEMEGIDAGASIDRYLGECQRRAEQAYPGAFVVMGIVDNAHDDGASISADDTFDYRVTGYPETYWQAYLWEDIRDLYSRVYEDQDTWLVTTTG